uniref:Uncharacterized protein n=1 Tax=Arundo donax TaxID=35708 RepID=A0A0A9HL00_ARUDO
MFKRQLRSRSRRSLMFHWIF